MKGALLTLLGLAFLAMILILLLEQGGFESMAALPSSAFDEDPNNTRKALAPVEASEGKRREAVNVAQLEVRPPVKVNWSFRPRELQPLDPQAVGQLQGELRANGEALPTRIARVSVVDDLGKRSQAQRNSAGYGITLIPGRYWVEARAFGFKTVLGEVFIDGLSEVKLDFDFEPAPYIDIHLRTPDGKNLFADARERGINLPHWNLWAIATIESPAPGFRGKHGVGQSTGKDTPTSWDVRIHLECDPPVFVSLMAYRHAIATRAVSPGVTSVEFVMTPDQFASHSADVAFRVVDDSTGAPITDEGVRVQSGFGEQMILLDGEGRGFAELVAPGRATLSIDSLAHKPWSKQVDLYRSEARDLGVIRLQNRDPEPAVVSLRSRGRRPIRGAIVLRGPGGERTYSVLDEAGVECASGTVRGQMPERLELQDGSYSVRIFADSLLLLEQPVELDHRDHILSIP